MNNIEKAIEELQNSLEELGEKIDTTMHAIEMLLRLDNNGKGCVDTPCMDCYKHGDNIDGTVCDRYVAKSDEIRRIHEEG